MVKETLWCLTCNLSHSLLQCIVEKRLHEERVEYKEYNQDHIINMLSMNFFGANDDYSSSKYGYEYGVNSMRDKQYYTQEVF